MMKTGSRFAHIWKKVRGNLSRLSFNEFKLATLLHTRELGGLLPYKNGVVVVVGRLLSLVV